MNESLEHNLKLLKLPTFLANYKKISDHCQEKGSSYHTFLLQLSEQEILNRQSRSVQQRIRKSKFPCLKTLDSFKFQRLPNLNKQKVVDLTNCDYLNKYENIIAAGNSGTGKTHLAISLGMAACQKGFTVGFMTAASLVHELLEAQEEKHLLKKT